MLDWNNISEMIRKLKTREGFVQFSVFLFVLGAYNVKHVASSIFFILFFLSIYSLIKPIKKIKLTKIEKYVFYFLVVYFLWFVITALIPGWEYDQTKRLGSEIRFIFAIPIYILLRQVKNLLLPLWFGVLVALWLGFFVTLYQVYILHIPAAGGYGKLLLGPMSVLYLFMFISRKNWAVNIPLKVFSIATVLVGTVPIILSGARTAYIMLIGLALIWIILNYSWRKQLLLIGGFAFIISGVYFGSDIVKSGVNRAVDGGVNYSAPSKELAKKSLGSTEARLEMIKAAFIIIQDNPVFGIGSGNFHKVSKEYIEAGLYHPSLAQFEHFHNIYADNAVKKGIPGLLLTLLMFFVPLWYFLKQKRTYYLPAAIGFYYVAGEILAGLTIVAPVDRGNFIAISVIILSVCLSEIMYYLDNNKVKVI